MGDELIVKSQTANGDARGIKGRYHEKHPLKLDPSRPSLGNHYVKGLKLPYDKKLVEVFEQLSDKHIQPHTLTWVKQPVIEEALRMWIRCCKWKKVVLSYSTPHDFDVRAFLQNLGVDCINDFRGDLYNSQGESDDYLKHDVNIDAFLFPGKHNTTEIIYQGWPREKIIDLKTLLAIGLHSQHMNIVFDFLAACKKLRKEYEKLSLFVPLNESYGSLLAKCLYCLKPDLFDCVVDYNIKYTPSVDESESYHGHWSFYEKHGKKSAIVFVGTHEHFLKRVSWCQNISYCSPEITVFAPYIKLHKARAYQHQSPKPTVIWETACTGSARSSAVLFPMAGLLGRIELDLDDTLRNRIAWTTIEETTKIARDYFDALDLYHVGRTHLTPLDLSCFRDTPLKIVMCSRDPRDMLFNYFGYHYTNFYNRSVDYLTDSEIELLIAIIQGVEVSRPNHHDKYYAHCINQFLIAQSMTNVRLLPFEEVHNNPLKIYMDIMRWLEWLPCNYMENQDIEAFLEDRIKISRAQHWENRVNSKRNGRTKHVIGKWKSWFPPRVIQVFKDIYGQALIDLGYEKNLDW